jgi:1-aminocyclopropane-1-carboxylate deaminase/D-cysteine desulfhydrase-like pyridoxal-dependent ACC family enzyme
MTRDAGQESVRVSGFEKSFPALAASLHRRPLALLPTPLEPASRLGTAIGAPNLLTKRDDQSGLPYGGNKVRKLEYLLGDALALGCDSVVTFGAAGSNHALATAVYAAQAGLTCHAVLVDQVATPYVANTLRWHALLGTRVYAAAGFAGTAALAARIRAEHPGGPSAIAEIPWGGSSVPGTVGFVAAGFEFAAQFRASGIPLPPRIYLPCGTMGSVAGLALGLAAAGLPATVVSVKVVPQAMVTAAAVGALAVATNEAVRRLDPGFPQVTNVLSSIEFRTGYLGAGYAEATAGGLEAAELAATLEGFRVDTTYSAKALACLIDDARGGRTAGTTPVFWQTWNSRPYPPGLPSADTGKLPEAFKGFLATG